MVTEGVGCLSKVGREVWTETRDERGKDIDVVEEGQHPVYPGERREEGSPE